MNRNSLLQTTLLCVGLLIVACKPQLPPGILSESKMERVLYDYHLAQGMAETAPHEEGRTTAQLQYEYTQAVFDKHGITEAEFDSSMVYYCSDLERMNRIYKNVSQRLQREADALGIVTSNSNSMYQTLTAFGDTANVWADRELFVVTPRQTDNLQMWQLTCDSTWLEGDDLIWHFGTDILTRGGLTECFADIIVTYSNDSVRVYLTSINSAKDYDLRVNNPEHWTPRHITGHLYCTLDSDPQKLVYIFVRNNSLIRLHKPQAMRDRWHQDTAKADSLAMDTLSRDTLSTDTLAADTADRRRSPQELREEQVIDRRINVVKQKPYQPQPNNRRRTDPMRRRRR